MLLYVLNNRDLRWTAKALVVYRQQPFYIQLTQNWARCITLMQSGTLLALIVQSYHLLLLPFICQWGMGLQPTLSEPSYYLSPTAPSTCCLFCLSQSLFSIFLFFKFSLCFCWLVDSSEMTLVSRTSIFFSALDSL